MSQQSTIALISGVCAALVGIWVIRSVLIRARNNPVPPGTFASIPKLNLAFVAFLFIAVIGVIVLFIHNQEQYSAYTKICSSLDGYYSVPSKSNTPSTSGCHIPLIMYNKEKSQIQNFTQEYQSTYPSLTFHSDNEF